MSQSSEVGALQDTTVYRPSGFPVHPQGDNRRKDGVSMAETE